MRVGADRSLAGGSGIVSTLSWTAPEHFGGDSGSLRYDAIRTTDPRDFVGPGVCVAADVSATQAAATPTPAVGEAFYYIIRSENACDPTFTSYRNCRELPPLRPAAACGLDQGQ